MRLKATAVLLVVAGMALSTFSALAALRVCADPDYLPYSNRAGEGFENKIAEAVAKALGEPLEYTWENTRAKGGFPEFLARTLNANKCDMVMNIPYGSREELTTRPYYISSYVFVFPRNRNYNIASMDSPALKKLRHKLQAIGVRVFLAKFGKGNRPRQQFGMADFLGHYLSIGLRRILALFLSRIGFVPLRKAIRLSTKVRRFFYYLVTLFFSAPLLRLLVRRSVRRFGLRCPDKNHNCK